MRSWKACLWLLGGLALSGLVLMLIYVPVSELPVYPKLARQDATLGHITRGLHFWLAQIAVAAVLVHSVCAFFVKTNWSRSGWITLLALMTGLFWFTGFLLPWDNLAFWMQSWLRGISAQAALWVVYWTHTLVLSLLMLPLLLVYIRRMRRDRASSA